MSGYRVAIEAEDPLAVDPARVEKQRRAQQLLVHGILAVASVGIWLPVFVWVLVTAWSRFRRFAEGYAVRLEGGYLSAGNAESSRSIPLDTVTGVTINSGYVTVTTRQSTLQLFGLRDPAAASRAILRAREEQLRGLRADVREEQLADVSTEQAKGRHGAQ